LIYRRDEDIEVTSKRHASIVRAIHGADSDGTLRAVQVEYLIDGGAYATLSPVVLFRGVVHAVGPYRCPNVDVQGYALATNNVPAGAFRGFGSPQVLFAAERQMDELARALQMDPFELRRRNLLHAGDVTVTGQYLPNSVGAVETLDQACAALEAHPPHDITLKPGEVYGRGVSTIYYGVGLGSGGEHMARAGAVVQINEDGSVTCAVGTTEIGQGMRTVLCQIAAETLGVRMDRVSLLASDTTRVPDSGPTVASRATTMSGRAVVAAAEQLRGRLLAAAAGRLGVAVHTLSLRDEKVAVQGKASGLTYTECIECCAAERVSLSAEGWYHPPHLEFDWSTGQGDAYAVYAYATNIAEVAVDRGTGTVRVLRIIAAHDVGKAVHPAGVEGQIEGGTLQGLGYALLEEVINENGRILNPQFSTYIIPTLCDVPEIIPVIVEDPYPDGPYGAKGFGEQPLMGIAPAVANAVCQALDIHLYELPLTPERVWGALQGADANGR
jgi:CO/xanthine dehydrogenase Mo-binding subunit